MGNKLHDSSHAPTPPYVAGISSTPGSTAWLTSMVIHLSLLVLAVLLIRHHAQQGMADEPSREAGIVLKHQTPEGPRFEGEESGEQEAKEPAKATGTASPIRPDRQESLEDALPSETELQNTQLSLPQPATPISNMGPSSMGLSSPIGSAMNPIGSATALTQGGKPRTQGGGGPAHVSVFGVEGVGSKFVYLFDRSVSMEGPLLAAAKSQLIASLQSLESVHQFQILFFNNDVQIWDLTGGQQRIPFATDRNKRLAARYVQGMTASGGTLRRRALQRALAMRPDVVFFLTDTDNKMASGDVARAIRQAVRNGTTIHTIEFGFGPKTVGPTTAEPKTGGSQGGRENFLTQLARGTGGQYAYIDTSRLGR